MPSKAVLVSPIAPCAPVDLSTVIAPNTKGILTQSGRFFLRRARQGDGFLALLQGCRHSVPVFRIERLLDASSVLLRVTAQASSRPGLESVFTPIGRCGAAGSRRDSEI